MYTASQCLLRSLVAPAAAVSLLMGATAWADPISVWVGQTKVMSLSVPVRKLTVDDPTVLRANKRKDDVTLVGQAPGKTELHVTTVDGDELTFVIHVTAQGGVVYDVERAERRHVLAQSEEN